MISIDRPELAWAAGLFEGEGCISLSRPKNSKNSAYPTAAIGMTDKEPIERFFRAVSIGRLQGPYKKSGSRKDVWEWRAHGLEQVEQVLALFWRYLSPRRKARAAEVIGGTRYPGRARGERSGTALLTEAGVREIRERFGGGETLSSIAKDFPLDTKNIWHVATGATWAHVPGAVDWKKRREKYYLRNKRRAARARFAPAEKA